MNDPKIYIGHGTPEMYDDLMDFLNYVFGFNGNDSDFKKLLPKLYNKEYDPTYCNYVVTENGKLKAAVGSYEYGYAVGDKQLKYRGIGNVAVHPYSRSKGYMKDCMNMAIDEMIKDGIDFSILGGQRQRYGYWGYELGGLSYSFNIDATNLRHAFRDIPLEDLEIVTVEKADTELLDAVYSLYLSHPILTIRTQEAFYDICTSHFCTIHAFLRNKECIAYCLSHKDGLNELTLADKCDFDTVIRNYVKKVKTAKFSIPMWDTELITAASRICEYSSATNNYFYCIFNYKNVISALLSYQAKIHPDCSGTCNLLIHGYTGDCCLKLTVNNGETCVEDISLDTKDVIELDKLDAVSFLLGLYSHKRAALPVTMRPLFPLPLCIDGNDHV